MVKSESDEGNKSASVALLCSPRQVGERRGTRQVRHQRFRLSHSAGRRPGSGDASWAETSLTTSSDARGRAGMRTLIQGGWVVGFAGATHALFRDGVVV